MSIPIQSLHIGMHVRHPQYGVGEVKSLTELTAEIFFDDARRTIAPASSELTPAEPTAAVSELQVPLSNFIRETAHIIVEALGLEKDDTMWKASRTVGKGAPSCYARLMRRCSRR